MPANAPIARPIQRNGCTCRTLWLPRCIINTSKAFVTESKSAAFTTHAHSAISGYPRSGAKRERGALDALGAAEEPGAEQDFGIGGGDGAHGVGGGEFVLAAGGRAAHQDA